MLKMTFVKSLESFLEFKFDTYICVTVPTF